MSYQTGYESIDPGVSWLEKLFVAKYICNIGSTELDCVNCNEFESDFYWLTIRCWKDTDLLSWF